VEFTIHNPFEGAPYQMSILTILLAVLLSGSGTLNMHPNSVIGGGPSGSPQPASISGGGPVGSPTVDSIYGGGPVG
jgi:hypothetical protein